MRVGISLHSWGGVKIPSECMKRSAGTYWIRMSSEHVSSTCECLDQMRAFGVNVGTTPSLIWPGRRLHFLDQLARCSDCERSRK